MNESFWLAARDCSLLQADCETADPLALKLTQRLLEIGLALAVRPRVLMLDEPLVGLAPAERERIVGLIKRLSEHMSVLVIEHDIDRVFAFAQDITVMHNGAVLAVGKPAEVRAHPQVQSVYLGTGRRISNARAPSGTTPAAGQ